jgi:hypothetical protein
MGINHIERKETARRKGCEGRSSVMANRSDRDLPSLYAVQDFESSQEMRRGSADSIRASRPLPAKQAGYKTAAYLFQRADIVFGKWEASI